MGQTHIAPDHEIAYSDAGRTAQVFARLWGNRAEMVDGFPAIRPLLAGQRALDKLVHTAPYSGPIGSWSCAVPTGSLVDAVEPQVRELLAQWPTMPATVFAERIGRQHSLTILNDRIRELRLLFVPPDPALRTTYSPGELAQCDLWFPPVDVLVGHGQFAKLPVW